jgi:aryl-alcohol dehydrogenase-like predicted oxidoreductase
MQTRKFGRLGWDVSEVGYGMWGIAGGWDGFTDGDLDIAPDCLDMSVERGVNFFDTAWIYAEGISEQMLGGLLRRHPGKKLYVATKIPPMTMKWPPLKSHTLKETYPRDHVREFAEISLRNLGTDCIDLLQFHTWEDAWAEDESWQRTMTDLQSEGLIKGIGISVNRWEPANCLKAIETGLIDAIQVIYNIFDQSPEDELFAVAQEKGVAIIGRVPFDEGGLTGALTEDTRFASDDWRRVYFNEENLIPTVRRAEALKAVVPTGMSLPELALRFILQNPAISTVIPGMRQPRHVDANVSVSGLGPLSAALMAELRNHRWDRQPASWSR